MNDLLPFLIGGLLLLFAPGLILLVLGFSAISPKKAAKLKIAGIIYIVFMLILLFMLLASCKHFGATIT